MNQRELEELLEELCEEIRLLAGRDTEKTLIRVFNAFLRFREPMGGTKIAVITGINRVTCIHHIKKLEKIGLLKRHEKSYVLRDLREFAREYRKLSIERVKRLENLISAIEEKER